MSESDNLRRILLELLDALEAQGRIELHPREHTQSDFQRGLQRTVAAIAAARKAVGKETS
jgi:hypothetical protein